MNAACPVDPAARAAAAPRAACGTQQPVLDTPVNQQSYTIINKYISFCSKIYCIFKHKQIKNKTHYIS